MILDSTTRSIQLVLAGTITTNQLKITADWVDMTATTTEAGSTPSTSNSTTAVTVVAAPAASTQRKVTNLAVFNADTASATVTIRYNDNASIYPIVTLAIPVGYTLFWTDVEGWKVISGTGSLQMGVVGPTGPTGPAGPTGPTGAVASRVVTALSISSGVVNIDLSLGDLFTLSLTANVTSITFSNLPGSGNGQAIFIRMKQDAVGLRTVAFPASFKAITGSDTAVQSAANAYTDMALTSVDNGTRWEYVAKAGAA